MFQQTFAVVFHYSILEHPEAPEILPTYLAFDPGGKEESSLPLGNDWVPPSCVGRRGGGGGGVGEK